MSSTSATVQTSASTAAAKAWDEVRAVFATSIMIDTSLNSLAQNLDGPEWPLKGKDETPAKYVDLNFEEVVELVQLKGQKPELAERLTAILKETTAFDSPYGEMIEQAQAASEKDNQLLKNLAKLGIPENFPIELTSLEAGTLEFCQLEKLSTLGEFAVFAQSMSQAVIVGGDFRKLLNALSHVDEAALAETMPFRPGQKGLHLAEAMGHAARSPNGAARAELATTWFHEDIALIETELAAGGSLERHFVVLGDPALEQQAMALLRPHLRVARKAVEKKKSGWFGWLFKGK
ncbi:MAG: hypothetical protein ABIQ12_08265 [Opitutaceae bacterium]